MSILKIIGILLEVVLLFNLLIVVHELGHFFAAKWRGLIIEGFGIWFGKPLWQKKIGGVTYSLGSIPAGGFVKLPQLMDSAIEGDSEYAGKELPRLKPLDKIIVAFAGPLFSFGLACFFAILVWQVGRPVTEAERTTIIGSVGLGSPAEKAGLLPGDKILTIDGHKIRRWGGQSEDSVTWNIASGEESTVRLEIERDGQTKVIEAKPEIEKTKWYQRRGLRQIHISPKSLPMVAKTEPGSAAAQAGFLPNDILTKVGGQPIYDENTISQWVRDHPREPVVITVERGEKGAGESVPTKDLTLNLEGFVLHDVFPDSPASRAGLQPGDRVLSVDGEANTSEAAFIEHVWAHDGKPVKLIVERTFHEKKVSRLRSILNSILRLGRPAPPAVERPPEKMEITVTPEVPLEGSKKASVGVGLSLGEGLVLDEHGKMWPIYPTPAEEISGAAGAIFETFKKLSPTSKSSISIQHMGGPVMMMRVYYLLFESPQGWRLVLWFSVVINVNLALMNMLPIPPLDGSHITLAIIELIRGRPPGERTQWVVERIQIVGTMLVIGFMLFVTVFDVQDLFGGKSSPMRFKPHASSSDATVGSGRTARLA